MPAADDAAVPAGVGWVDGTPEAYREAVSRGAEECARLVEAVDSMREIVLAPRSATEQDERSEGVAMTSGFPEPVRNEARERRKRRGEAGRGGVDRTGPPETRTVVVVSPDADCGGGWRRASRDCAGACAKRAEARRR